MAGYRSILVGVDFSEATELVCERAAEFARGSEANLGLIHVLEPIVVDPVYDMVPAIPAELEVERTRQAREALNRLGERYGVPAERCWIESGITKTAILDKAAEVGVDLIVLGSHGRHGAGLLLGSTANAVLHGARCDVLAVRVGV